MPGRETAGNWRPAWITVTLMSKKKKIKTKSKETLCFCLRQGFFYAVLAGLDYIGQDRLELMKSTCFYLQVLG